MKHDTSARPVLVAIAGIGLLVIVDAVVKKLTSVYTTADVLLLRYGSGLIFAGLIFAAARPGWPSRAQWPRYVVRTVVVMTTAATFFYAVAHLPLAEVITIAFLSPLFMALFGRIFLGERFHARVGVALLLGFAGMLVIVGTGEGVAGPATSWLPTIAAVISPVSYALSIVLLRHQSGDEPITRIMFVQVLLGLLVIAPFRIGEIELPRGDLAWLALASGAFGTVGNLLVAWAVSRAPAARVGVTEYTGLVWASILGYVFFAEVPRPAVLAGALLIVAGCVLVMRAKRVPVAQSSAETV